MTNKSETNTADEIAEPDNLVILPQTELEPEPEFDIPVRPYRRVSPTLIEINRSFPPRKSLDDAPSKDNAAPTLNRSKRK